MVESQVAPVMLANGQGGLAGGDGGGEEPHRKRPLESGHCADGADAKLRRLDHSCPLCGRQFCSKKALHGHMRAHPDRWWRGMAPPPPPPSEEADMAPKKAAAAAAERTYQCKHCKAAFRTPRALGGHRASHRDRKGCYRLSREQPRGASGRGGAAQEGDAGGNRNSGGGGGGGRGGSGGLLCDLNLPPPEAEVQQEDGDRPVG